MRCSLAVFVLIVVLVCVPAASADGPSLGITYPSDNETRFAELRDFYVYGTFSPAIGNPGDIRVELYPESACTGNICTGVPVRSIQSHVDPVTGVTNSSQIDWSFVGSTSASPVRGGYVPDIIKEPGGYTDPNNKVVVTNTYYGALVLGGVTKNYNTTYKNSSGDTLQDLTAGNYKLNVTGLSGSLAGSSATKTLTFGITDTALGTNRPTNSKNVRIQYAIDHGLRTYFDNFPGYFSDGGNNWSNFRTLAAPNNGIEIVNDLSGTMIDTVAVANNTMFVYNINSASTTYAVEVAPVLKYSLQDGVNTTFLYYENGEPVLTYNNSQGAPQQVTSALRQFTGSNRIALTHVDVRTPAGTSYENLYDPNDTAWKAVYINPTGTIPLSQGQAITAYGVTKPIASTVSSTSTPYWYTIDNRIATLAGSIKDSSGTTISSSTHEVNLSRYYNNYPGSSNPYQKYNSLFEFGSDFTAPTTPGTYTITLVGKDETGAVVTGATTSFTLMVNSPGTSASNDGPGVSGSGAPRVSLNPGAPAGQPVTFAFSPVSSSGTSSVQSVTLIPSRTTGQVECILTPVTPGAPIQLGGREVAGYYSITVNWINPDAIDHGDIVFSVEKAWLDEHHILPEQVVMLRYVGSQWVELPTRLKQTGPTAYVYDATTPGFSYFAVARKADTSAQANTTAVVPSAAIVTPGVESPAAAITSTPPGSGAVESMPTTVAAPATAVTPAQPTIVQVFFPSEGLPLVTIIAWVVVIVIIIVVVWLVRRWWIRRQNPALFRKYD